MSPATKKLIAALIRCSRGALTALEQWVEEVGTEDIGAARQR